jgi:thiamine-monophosphate kinase
MFENKENRTDLSTLGEFGFIEHIAKSVSLKNASSLKGIGDDAAIIDNGNKMTVVSTDMLVEGVHFDLAFHPLKHLGYKAVTVNLSDIYAMNATPHQITVSIAMSNRFSLEAIEELYVGIFMACERHEVDLVGGDTTSSTSGLIISITAIGTADKEDVVYRNTAGVNDLVCVSGDLGGAYIGLQLLEREKKIFVENPKIQPDLEGNDYILERQLKPEARKDVIAKLKEQKIKPTAMIDISDGLSSDLLHICKQSDVGSAIYEEKLPIDVETFNAATEFNLDPLICALNGGEDYELLFTIKQEDYEKIKSIKEVSVIGHITEKNAGVSLVDKSGSIHPIKAQGWDALLE